MKRPMEGKFLSPPTAALVGAQVDGHICPFNFAKHVFFSIFKKRYTHRGIIENRTFSVNIPTVDMLAKLEIAGRKSGREFDKSALLDTFYGELGTAPMIRECPITMECEVNQLLDCDLNHGVIGRVVRSYVEEDLLTDDKLDLRKMDPLVWAIGGDSDDHRVGSRIDCG